MTVKTIEELFIHELSDIYSAEIQLTTLSEQRGKQKRAEKAA